MKTSKFTYGVICLIAVTGFASVAMTQEARFPDDVGRSNRPQGFDSFSFQDRGTNSPVMRVRQRSRTVTKPHIGALSSEEVEEIRLLQTAMKSLKTSSSDADIKKAVDIIQAQLTRQFERDLKQREKELAAVEDRVLKLRQQFDKRKTAQTEIIQLRLQTLINVANGLGFPANSFDGSAGRILGEGPDGFYSYPLGNYSSGDPRAFDDPMSDLSFQDPAGDGDFHDSFHSQDPAAHRSMPTPDRQDSNERLHLDDGDAP